ncbi:nucleotidyltransferase domain-containing protein [Geomicrobium sp. JCM 19055]|uniref:nucleotidyltransferase domain-containing protein n=1 Tax=Geomicrobium sp. JCM 19055 TaxID=1460649 RepID=UPI00223589A2|nr:nucleotidyltransferase domain-containing protein [Geomicrobium sp. JCM 19055]
MSLKEGIFCLPRRISIIKRRFFAITLIHKGYGLDEQGYIQSDVVTTQISLYNTCIQDCVAQLKQAFPKQVHSVYVYGSVARGEAVKKKSDLDLLVLFREDVSEQEKRRLNVLGQSLSKTYVDDFREVGIAFTNYDYTMDPKNYDEQAFLKELSICVEGNDLRSYFGPYRLTSEIAIRFNGDINAVYERAMKRLYHGDDEEFRQTTIAFARKLIRTYYSMVMLRSQIWTTRLHEQAQVIVQSLLEKSSVIKTLLNWIDEPPTNPFVVLNLYEQEGNWLSEHFHREAKKG